MTKQFLIELDDENAAFIGNARQPELFINNLIRRERLKKGYMTGGLHGQTAFPPLTEARKVVRKYGGFLSRSLLRNY